MCGYERKGENGQLSTTGLAVRVELQFPFFDYNPAEVCE